MIPKARLDEVIAQRDAAKAEAERLGSRVAELEPLGSRVGVLEQDLQLAGLGLVDEEARKVARLFHGTLPEADRPELHAWVQHLRADPTAAPRGLQPYLAPASTPAPAGGPQPAPTPPAAPPAQPQPAPPSSGVSEDQLRVLRERYQRTRSPSDGKALEAAIAQNVKARRG
jgi:hypothetical protein